MIGMNLAVVHQQIPERHGVLVAWRDGTSQADTGGAYGFCRVGATRAHPTLGSASDLPAVGELGLVLKVDAEVCVWVCSLHWQNDNALLPGTSFWHHDSGATFQIDAEGQWQIALPTGISIRSTRDDSPLALPPGAIPGGTDVFPVTISHPSGLSVSISSTGDLAINDAASISATSGGKVSLTSYGSVSVTTLPMAQDPNQDVDAPADGSVGQPAIDINVSSGGAVNLKATGDVSVSGNTLSLQGGTAQFLMAPFVTTLQTYLSTHTHGGVTSGSSVSSPPVTPLLVTDVCYSGGALKGSTGP